MINFLSSIEAETAASSRQLEAGEMRLVELQQRIHKLTQQGAQIAVESKSRRGAAFTVTFRTGDDAAQLPPNDVVNLRKSNTNATQNGVLWKILGRAG